MVACPLPEAFDEGGFMNHEGTVSQLVTAASSGNSPPPPASLRSLHTLPVEVGCAGTELLERGNEGNQDDGGSDGYRPIP